MVTRRNVLPRLAVACTATGAGVGHVAAEQRSDGPAPWAAPRAAKLAASPEARGDTVHAACNEAIRALVAREDATRLR